MTEKDEQNNDRLLNKEFIVNLQKPPVISASYVLLSGNQHYTNRNIEDIKASTRGVLNQVLLTISVFILAAGCGMPIGYSAIVLPQLYNSSDTLSMDIEMGSWFASLHSLATPIGSFCSGPLMDRFGRKPTILYSIVPLLIGWITLATSSSHFFLLAGRMISGIAVGLIGAPAQVYVAEASEPRLRGLLVGVPMVAYSLGILFVYGLGALLNWRYVAWCGMLLPCLAACALFFVPETPAWLARNNYLEKSLKALTWLRHNDVLVKKELYELVYRFENEKNTRKTTNAKSLLKTCTNRSVLKPLIIINGFHFLLALSGTYLIIFYAVDMISEFGADINNMTAAVLTAAVRLFCIVVYCVLLFYVNRRKMVISSGIGTGISSILLSIFLYCRIGKMRTPLDLYVTASLMLLYIAFNTGFIIMPGIMIGELLPARIRGQIAGYIFAALNLCLFGTTKIFPYMNTAIKTHGLFLLFGASSFGVSLLLYLLMPETRGKTLGSIEDYFSQNNWIWRSKKEDDINKK